MRLRPGPAGETAAGSIVPGSSGSPAFVMSWRAVALLPIFSMTSACGPMKVMPWSSQISAK
jgi:hypothetical protein